MRSTAWSQTVASSREIERGRNSIIEEIAAPKNLLALNALIEAARAAEDGKGLTVAATVMKKLLRREDIMDCNGQGRTLWLSLKDRVHAQPDRRYLDLAADPTAIEHIRDRLIHLIRNVLERQVTGAALSRRQSPMRR